LLRIQTAKTLGQAQRIAADALATPPPTSIVNLIEAVPCRRNKNGTISRNVRSWSVKVRGKTTQTGLRSKREALEAGRRIVLLRART
jgi:hypothetical protein